MTARPQDPAPHTPEEHLQALLLKRLKRDTHRPSAPRPLSRAQSASIAEGRFIPTVSLDAKSIELIPGVDQANIGYVRVALAESESIREPEHGLLWVAVLMECFHRFYPDVDAPQMPSLVWQLCFDAYPDELPPPPGLMPISQMYPWLARYRHEAHHASGPN